MSQSSLTDYWDNPYKWRNGPTDRKTDPMTFGSIVDALLLTSDLLDSQFIISPYRDFKTAEAQCFRDMVTMPREQFLQTWIPSPHDNYRSKAAQEWKAQMEKDYPSGTFIPGSKVQAVSEKYKAAAARADGTIPAGAELITGSDMAEAERALTHFKESDFAWVFNDGARQKACQWKLEGTPFKALIDFVPDPAITRKLQGYELGRCLIDFKTAADASMFGFRRSARRFRYDIQASIYLTAWNELYPEENRDTFVWVVMESHSPYACACYVCTPRDLGTAEHNESWPHGWRTMLEGYQTSLDFNKWRDYNYGGPVMLSLWERMED